MAGQSQRVYSVYNVYYSYQDPIRPGAGGRFRAIEYFAPSRGLSSALVEHHRNLRVMRKPNPLGSIANQIIRTFVDECNSGSAFIRVYSNPKGLSSMYDLVNPVIMMNMKDITYYEDELYRQEECSVTDIRSRPNEISMKTNAATQFDFFDKPEELKIRGTIGGSLHFEEAEFLATELWWKANTLLHRLSPARPVKVKNGFRQVEH